MEKLSRQTINKLLVTDVGGPAVTIYCPTHRQASPQHMSEDQVRFKNLIHKAASTLRQHGSHHLATQLCQKLDELLNDRLFWESQTEGLLLCARAEQTWLYNLPVDTEEYVAVDETLHLAPILGLIQDDTAFYVLTVTQHKPALFSGDMYGLDATAVELPETLEAGLNLDEVNQKSEHARSVTGTSSHPAGFHGRGGARNPREEDRARFFRLVDHTVCTHAERARPLILAGIDAETAEYKQLSKYPKITDRTIAGSFSDAKAHDLFVPARDIIRKEIINKQHDVAIEECVELKGAWPERIALTREAIGAAANEGRIDKLLVRMLRYTTDTVKDTKEAATRITFPDLDLSAAVNRLAVKVWQSSGKIIGLEYAQMPDGAAMIARLRY